MLQWPVFYPLAPPLSIILLTTNLTNIGRVYQSFTPLESNPDRKLLDFTPAADSA